MALLCRGGERGTARPEVLQSLLKTTERVVQEIDSVEYGLTDIQVHLSHINKSLHEVSFLLAAVGHLCRRRCSVHDVGLHANFCSPAAGRSG